MRPVKERGVNGLICPVALGSYRYRKRRDNGASVLLDIEVFPLAVNAELASWKEQAARERWFTLSEAAEAIDGEDLCHLIRSFDPIEFSAAARRTSLKVVVRSARIDVMFGWFQRLLPKTGNFFEMFEAHLAISVVEVDATAGCSIVPPKR
jgi:hypothetical protein